MLKLITPEICSYFLMLHRTQLEICILDTKIRFDFIKFVDDDITSASLAVCRTVMACSVVLDIKEWKNSYALA